MSNIKTFGPYVRHLQERCRDNIPQVKQGLISRNVKIQGRRTSVRLEAEMWMALYDVAALEGCSVNDICTEVAKEREEKSSFTAALRVFLLLYFRNRALVDIRLQQVSKALHGTASR